MDEWDRAVGIAVATWRSRRDMSQEGLATAMTDRNIGWNQSTVSAVESGRRSLKLKEAVMLEKILKINQEKLFAEPRAQVDRVLADLRDQRAILMVTAVGIRDNQRLLASLAREFDISISAIGLSEEDLELATLPVDEIAARVLSDASEKVGASQASDGDAKRPRVGKVVPRGGRRERTIVKHQETT